MNEAITIKNGLSAYFKQPSGPSRPGIDWALRIGGEHGVAVMVRTFFSSDPPQQVEQQAMAQKAIQFIQAKLEQGWVPEAGTWVAE